MDKRIIQFKLMSYRQALQKAQEKHDQPAVKRWINDINELQHELNNMTK